MYLRYEVFLRFTKDKWQYMTKKFGGTACLSLIIWPPTYSCLRNSSLICISCLFCFVFFFFMFTKRMLKDEEKKFNEVYYNNLTHHIDIWICVEFIRKSLTFLFAVNCSFFSALSVPKLKFYNIDILLLRL